MIVFAVCVLPIMFAYWERGGLRINRRSSYSGSSLEREDLLAGVQVIGIWLHSECKRVAQINLKMQHFFICLTFKSGSLSTVLGSNKKQQAQNRRTFKKQQYSQLSLNNLEWRRNRLIEIFMWIQTCFLLVRYPLSQNGLWYISEKKAMGFILTELLPNEQL